MTEPAVQNLDRSKTIEGQHSTLRRLLRERDANVETDGLAPQLPLPGNQSPAEAAGIALRRVGNALLDLPIQNEKTVVGAVTLAELPEHIGEDCLIAVLQGQGEALGVMALDLAAVVSLIEVQTLGRVTPRNPQRRLFTRGDALMCAEFVNALTGELGRELEGHKQIAGISDFRYASYLTETRPLNLILEDRSYRSLSFSMQMGRGFAREATIFLAVPLNAGQSDLQPPKAQIPGFATVQPLKAPQNPPSALPRTGRGQTLKAALQQACVDVVAVLCRQKITLRQLRNLQTGQALTLPRADLARINLELEDGTLLTTGKLGELGGFRALRMHDPAQTDQTGGPLDLSGFAPDVEAPGLAAAPAVDLEAPDPLREPLEFNMEMALTDDFVTDETQSGAA